MKHRWLIVTLIGLLALSGLLGALLFVPIPHFLNKKVITQIERQIPDSVPLQIQELNLSFRLWDVLFTQQIAADAFVSYKNYHLKIDLEAIWKKKDDQISLKVNGVFKPGLEKNSKINWASSLNIKGTVFATANNYELQRAQLELWQEDFQWSAFQVAIQDLSVKGLWQYTDLSFKASLAGNETTWTQDEEHIFQITSFDVTASGDMKQITSEVEVGEGEILWGEEYWILPTDEFHFDLMANIEDSIKATFIATYQKANQLIVSFAQLKNRWNLRWKTSELPLEKLQKTYLRAKDEGSMFFELSSGNAQTSGEINLTSRSVVFKKLNLEIKELTSRLSSGLAKIIDASVLLRVDADKATSGYLHLNRILFKNLVIDAKKFALDLALSKEGLLSIQAKPADALSLNKQSISIPQLDIAVSQLSEFDLNNLSLDTAIDAPQINIRDLFKGLCLDARLAPKADLIVDLSRISLKNGSLSTVGSIYSTLFSGRYEIRDLAAKHFLTAAPEWNFNVDWDNLQLSSIGKWLKFGKMDGILRGYARNVTLQGLIPTRYDFKIEVAPHEEKEVVFSPEAMKNVVSMITSDEINKGTIGVVMNWLAFGWPSDLLGGYNIQYAGITLYSDQDSILLETLDPEEIVQRDKRHYLLYGRRFKIPVNSFRYPVVLDAPGIVNWAMNSYRVLMNLQTNDTVESNQETPLPNKEISNEQKTHCQQH
jgi:hypothetical protein